MNNINNNKPSPLQQQQQPNATQFIIQNGNIYQLTTNIRNNTNININNAIINNNMIFTTTSNNNNNLNQASTVTATQAATKATTVTTSAVNMPPKTVIQSNMVLQNTKKVVYKADYQQCQQAIQQQYHQKQTMVLQKIQQQQTPSIIMLASNKNNELASQQHQQQNKQKICYIPVSQANKVFTNGQQPQITQTVKTTPIASKPHIVNKPINLTQIRAAATPVQPVMKQQQLTQHIASPQQQPAAAVVTPIQQEPAKPELHQQPKLLNEYVLPDSRIFKKLFKNMTQKSQQQGQLQHLNEVLTYKTVKIGNLEHIIIDNVENLNNFKGNIDKLQTYAYTLATKLNKPVTIPAYLLLKKDQGCLNNIENVLKEKNIKPLLINNASRKRKLADQQPTATATLPIITTSKQPPQKAEPELRSLLTSSTPSKSEPVYKFQDNTATTIEQLNSMMSDNSFFKQEPQETNNFTSLNNSDLDQLLASLSTTATTSTSANNQTTNDYDFNLDLFDSFNTNALNDMDFYQSDFNNRKNFM